MNKFDARVRRGRKTKAIQKFSDRPVLVVHRSNTQIYAQIVTRGPKGDVVIASCSSIDTEIKPSLNGTKVEQAKLVGQALAKKAKEKSISKVAFDRSGYKYHGRIKAIADGAREEGLDF